MKKHIEGTRQQVAPAFLFPTACETLGEHDLTPPILIKNEDLHTYSLLLSKREFLIKL